MTEDIILAIFLLCIVGVCGVISLTSVKKEKPEEDIA